MAQPVPPDAGEPLSRPAPIALANPEQILLGPPIDALTRVRTYPSMEFELFIQEWAYYYLQEMSREYTRVVWIGGAKDRGRDVIGYFRKDGVETEGCDFFQCKHYDHAIQPAEFWVELGKLTYNTYRKDIPIPRAYYLVAPFDAGPELTRLLDAPEELRTALIEKWPSHCEREISKGVDVPLEGDLLAYVEAFDFSIVKVRPILQVLSEHGRTIRRAPRFGGGLNAAPPPDPVPPADIAIHERRYVAQLLAAYGDKLKSEDLSLQVLERYPTYERHFHRSRQRYYCAEALRVFARDNLPENVTFEQVQDQVFDAVIDIHERDYSDGFDRVVATTQAASSVAIMNHILRSYLKSQSLQGICHQLANVDKLTWVK